MDATSWGTTRAERSAHYPCDDLGFAFDEPYFRAVDVSAPPAVTFRWLCQLRAAPYSYDWLDNFGRRSPPRLTPGLERLEAGQRVMSIFRLARFVPGSSLTLVLASRAYEALLGNLAGSYVVEPSAAGSRLLAKILVRYPPGARGRALRAVLPGADLVMFRKQLRTLRGYAERDAAIRPGT